MTSVLIIEDDYILRKQISDFLHFEGFSVLSAENGSEGLEMALSNLPDIIVCDIMMPDLSGYEVLENLRREPSTCLIPFVFLSAKVELADHRKGMNLGADDYLAKPVDHEDLLKTINVRLQKNIIVQQRLSRRLEELRSSISFALPHEFRTSLNGVLGFSQILLDGHKTLDDLEITMMLRMIHDSGKKLLHLVANFSLYTNLLGLEIINDVSDPVHSINKTIMDVALSVAERSNREGDLNYNFSDDAVLYLQLNHFSKLVEELADNCFKFSESGSRVEISTWKDANSIIVAFNNHGTGFTEEQIKNIGAFVQFERAKQEQQGMGLGLAIVKKIVELYEGKFEISNHNSSNTSVRLVFFKPRFE